MTPYVTMYQISVDWPGGKFLHWLTRSEVIANHFRDHLTERGVIVYFESFTIPKNLADELGDDFAEPPSSECT